MAKKFKNTLHRNPFREDREKPPFPWMAVIIGVLIIAVVILASVYIYQRFGSEVRTFSSDAPGATAYDPRSRITYEYSALNGYQASGLGDVYGKCGDYTFYKINGADPEEILFASILIAGDELPYGIFCVSGYVFPEVEKFTVSSGSVHETEYDSIPVAYMDADAAGGIMKILLEREGVSYPSGIDADSVMDVYFYSKEYSHLCYTVKYFRTKSGDRYLSDSNLNKHVKLMDGEFTDYLPES